MRVLCIFSLFFLLFLSANAQVWENAGLASQKQRDAGYIGGEGGQWPQALAIDNADGNVMLHGSDVGGLWRSTNGGQLWEPANNGYTPRGTCGLFIDPGNPARAISVGSNSGKAAWDNYHGLYLTTDTAKTWKQVLKDNACGYRDIREQVAFDPTSFNAAKGYCMIVYYSRIAWTAGSEGGSGTLTSGIYKSPDGGSTWKIIANSKNYGSSVIKVHPTRGYLFAANSSGFFISKDEGANFVSTLTQDVKGFDLYPKDPSRVYLCTTNKIYISSDTGATFIAKSSTGFTSYANYLRVSPADNQYMITQHANPSDPWNTYYLYSHNEGASWTKTSSDNRLDFLPRNMGRLMYPSWSPVNKNELFAVGGDFITKSTNGGASLVWANNGASAIMSAGALTFNLDNPNLIFFSAQDYDASVSLDKGYTYKYLDMSRNGWGGNIHGGYVADSLTWFGRSAAGWEDLPCDIKITFNGGQTYLTKGKSGGLSSCYGVPGDRNVLFAGDMRSTDKGITWVKMTGCDGVFTSDPTGSHDLYGVYNSTSIVKSTDKGANWEPVAILGSRINDIAFDHVNNAVYASCYTGGLWKVYASDSSVVDITLNTPADQYSVRRFSTVAVDPRNPEIVYSGGTRDIYSNDVSVIRSTDGGDSWIPLTVAPRHSNPGFGISAGRETSMIRVNPETGYAWCGSSCFGMWKIAAPDSLPDPIAKIRLNQSRLVLHQNDLFQLKAIVTHSSDTLVDWRSSDITKVIVDTTGLVTAISTGSANIIAETKESGLQAACLVVVSEPKGPYLGTARQIPGTLQAEDFDTGGEGAGYHDASLVNEGSKYRTSEAVDIEVCSEGGFNVGWTAAGEWLSYTVEVDSTMDYDIEVRAAVNAASILNITFSEGNISTGDVSLPATGGWQNWKNFTRKAISLNAGIQEMRISMTVASFNLNYVKISRSFPLMIKSINTAPELIIFPNPFKGGLLNISLSGHKVNNIVEIYTIQGKRIFSAFIKNDEAVQVDKYVLKKGIYLVKIFDIEQVIATKLFVQ